MTAKTITIAGRRVGYGMPCFIIAELAQAHDGSLGIAHSYIDAVAATCADAIKFQTHIADAESTSDEPFRIKFSYQDATRYDYWRRMEFIDSQWSGLAEHCADVGLIFLSSPFSVEAVKLLDKLGMPAWKVGSGEVNNPVILEAMIKTQKPILLSSGMSDLKELELSVQRITKSGSDLALFQCTSKYPTSFSDVGLNVIDELRKRFQVPVGLSDHSGTVFPGLAAMARGADILEVHTVFSRSMFGPDTAASLTLEELKELVTARNAFHEMFQHPVDKDVMAKELVQSRQLFNKSVSLKKNMSEGAILTDDVLTVKKPGTGIPAERLSDCIGKRLTTDVPNDRVLNWKDIEDCDSNSHYGIYQ